MFKEVTSNPQLDVNQARETSVTLASSASMEAEEIMDELFHDIEVHLDNPDSVNDGALSTDVDTSNISLRQTLSRKPLKTHQSSAEPEDLVVSYTPMYSTLALQKYVEDSVRLTSLVKQPTQPVHLGRRLLISTACVSFAGLTMFWVGRQLRWQHAPVVAAAPPAAMTSPAISPETLAFADYVTQSLDRIKQDLKAEKIAIAQDNTVNTAHQSNAGLPNLPNSPSVSVANANSTTVIPSNVERVYVPVADLPTPNLKGKPLAPPANTPVIATAKANPEKKALTKENDSALPILKPLPLTPPSSGERKFLGGTNLGDQPMFMVSINGATRHIKLGEAVDETGATFVEFDGEQSILKQGSQLRSVTAGQSF